MFVLSAQVDSTLDSAGQRVHSAGGEIAGGPTPLLRVVVSCYTRPVAAIFTASPSSGLDRAAAAVTPVILCWNEAPNLERTLQALQWARRVVVVDSGSTDESEALARAYPNVDWRLRAYDDFAGQWQFAVAGTGIETEFALALDADMAVTPAFVAELEAGFCRSGCDGGLVRFQYRLDGRRLLGSVYPPQLRLFRPAEVRITQPGHTQEFAIAGRTYRFSAPVIHDDRKPLARWVQSQVKYVELEAARIERAGGRLGVKDRLRLTGLAPWPMAAWSYGRAGGPVAGRAALRYAWERMTFETLLALRLLRK